MYNASKNYKVLMVAWRFPPDFAGATIQSIRLGKALLSRRVRVEFFADNGIAESVYDIYDGVKVTRTKTYSNKTLSKFRELVFCIKLLYFVISRPEFNIIHFHAIRGFEIFLFPIFRLLGRKVFLKLTLADSDDPVSFKNRRLLGAFYLLGLKCVTGMFAISEQLKNRALVAGIAKTKVIKISNGFDEELFFVPDPDIKLSLRNKFGFKDNSRIFVSVGTVEHRKGYDLLLEAFAIIQKKYHNAFLVIVGPYLEADPYYMKLRNQIDRLKLNNILFVGRQNDVHEYFKAADHFLFCSRQEGFPSVLIEAMACGLPTTVMNIAGITEEIIDGTGLGEICYSRDPADFAKLAIQQSLEFSEDKVLHTSELLLRKFSISNIADEYIGNYNKCFNISDT